LLFNACFSASCVYKCKSVIAEPKELIRITKEKG